MKTVIIASNNPVKARAAQSGFERMFPDESFIVHPLNPALALPAQPFSDEETLECAVERVRGIHKLEPQADYWVGIEGGVTERSIGMGTFAWVVICDQTGKTGQGRTGEFFLPGSITTLVRQGVELGEADDRVFSRKNSKQSNGAIGILTNDAIDRTALYIPAVIFALIPFKNPDLYS